MVSAHGITSQQTTTMFVYKRHLNVSPLIIMGQQSTALP